MSLASLGYVGYGKETTEGTRVAPTKFLPVSSFSFEDSNDFIVPDQIRFSRDRYVAMPAPVMVSGSMELELVPKDISSLLKAALAASVNSSPYSGGGYEHVFTPGNTADTFSFESAFADIVGIRYGGVRVAGMEIRAAYGEIVTASFQLEGLNSAKETSLATPTYADVVPFHFSGASVKIAGSTVSTIKDFTFNVGNNPEKIGTLRKTRDWRRTALGMRDVGLSVTADFNDDDELDRFLASADTPFEVELHLEAGTIPSSGNKHTIVISVPVVRWSRLGHPIDAGGYLEQSLEATIIRGSGENVLDLTLVNDESSVA